MGFNVGAKYPLESKLEKQFSLKDILNSFLSHQITKTSQDNQGRIYRNCNSSNLESNKSNNNLIKENPPVHNGNSDSNSRRVLKEKRK